MMNKKQKSTYSALLGGRNYIANRRIRRLGVQSDTIANNEEKVSRLRIYLPRHVNCVRSTGRAGSLRARRQRYKSVDDDVRRGHVNHGMAEHVCPAYARIN